MALTGNTRRGNFLKCEPPTLRSQERMSKTLPLTMRGAESFATGVSLSTTPESMPATDLHAGISQHFR
jgi:hypothetical protein